MGKGVRTNRRIHIVSCKKTSKSNILSQHHDFGFIVWDGGWFPLDWMTNNQAVWYDIPEVRRVESAIKYLLQNTAPHVPVAEAHHQQHSASNRSSAASPRAQQRIATLYFHCWDEGLALGVACAVFWDEVRLSVLGLFWGALTWCSFASRWGLNWCNLE